MRHFLLALLLTTFVSCKNEKADEQIPSKTNRESIEQEIVGTWELLKAKSHPGDEPHLIEPMYREYLDIKVDGSCQDGRSEAKWFLSYTNDYVVDSTSKIIFTELTNVKPNSWGDYDRTIKPYQINVVEENNTKYLYLTSLQTSATRIYIRKV